MIWSSQPKINNKHFHLSLWVGYPATLFSWSNITALFLNKFIFCACLALTLPQLTRSADLDWLTSVCTWIESAKEIHVYFKINSSIRCTVFCDTQPKSAVWTNIQLLVLSAWFFWNPEYTQVYKNEPHRLWLDINGHIYQNTDSLTISPGDCNIFLWLNRCELLQFTWKQCKIK